MTRFDMSAGSPTPLVPISMTFFATISAIGSSRSTKRSERIVRAYADLRHSICSGGSLLPWSNRSIEIDPRPTSMGTLTLMSKIRQNAVGLVSL